MIYAEEWEKQLNRRIEMISEGLRRAVELLSDAHRWLPMGGLRNDIRTWLEEYNPAQQQHDAEDAEQNYLDAR